MHDPARMPSRAVHTVAMRPLPTGTLTLLFSDIEGSTALLHGLGPRWGEALSAQRRILRAAFGEHDGHEMGTEGDSFFVVFASAHEALHAAIDAQRGMQEHEWPDNRVVRVRIGLHTGEPARHEDGYIGVDVHRAARIAATASGGQIVVSASTQALLTGRLGQVELRDLGWHRLKDLPEAEHLFDVCVPGLPTDHPPVRSLGTRANLPTYSTELVGRAQELAELDSAIVAGGARLVTLTGPGGTGKTRLAVAVARGLQKQLSLDAFFVPLHTADRSALVWSGIVDAVGASADAETTPEQRAMQFLADRSALLVLDNLEQIDDADAVVSRLLSDAPGIRILATSRRPLHLIDEHQFPVPPLEVPPWDRGDPVEVAQGGAVDLFVRRARMVKRSFELTPGNAADVLALCRRLDGLPLAIELAAARSRLLSPSALLQRLDDRLNDPTGGVQRVGRQRTLRETIAWSYDLLDPPDQAVFRRLGAFSSRVDLDAVARVARTDDRDPLDVVAHLVDVSLVEIVDGPDGEPMVWLLETIRRFAQARLRESGEFDEVRLEHAQWCLDTVERITQLLGTSRQMNALDRMKAVEEDVRSALDWCLTPTASAANVSDASASTATAAPTAPAATERQEVGFALLEPMDRYWYRFGYIAEGRGWHDRAWRLLVRDELPDSPRVLDALYGQGILALQQLDLVTGAEALERALAMSVRIGDRSREARVCNSLGIARREAGRLADARELIERSLVLAREIGDPHREATALTNMVHVAMDAGDYAGAVVAAQRAVAADRALGDPWGIAVNQCNLVVALLNSEGPQPALTELREVASHAVSLNDIALTVELLDTSAAVWAALGDGERAAALLGASDHHREVTGLPRTEPDERLLSRFVEPARQAVPADAWERAHRAGGAMTAEAAMALGIARETIPVPHP